MRCEDFRERLFPYIDGELPETDARAAGAHAAACTDCAERAEFEHRLEARVGAALLGAADGVDTAGLIAAAERGAAKPVAPSGKLLRMPVMRRLAATAAVLLVMVQAAWFFCIPPFECSILQAVERTTAHAGQVLRPGVTGPAVAARIDVPVELAGLARDGDPVAFTADVDRVRARFVRDGEAVDVVWTDAFEVSPSFRREREIDGETWWVAEENGRSIVAWMCPATRTLCTLVGELPEERLLEVARELRSCAN